MKRLIFISLIFLTVCLQGQVLKTHPTYVASKAEETGGYDPPSSWSSEAYGWYTLNEGDFTKDANNYVTEWADSLGSGHDLIYVSASYSQPKWTADSVTFDGTTDILRTATGTTLDNPITVYIVFNQLTWTLNDRIFAGRASQTGRLYQRDDTPQLDLYNGAQAGIKTSDLALNTWGIAVCVFNGASSFIQINGGTERTSGDPGTSNPSGFVLGADAAATNFGNVKFKEVIVVAGVDDATTRLAGYNYLKARYGL